MHKKIHRLTPVLLFFLLILFLLGLFLLASLADAPVTFQDQTLELEIRKYLNHYSKPLYKSQLLDIHTLDLSDKGIADLAGIEHLRNLQVLNLAHNHISDVSPLRTLRSLRSLDLQDNGIVDLDQVNFGDLSKLGLLEVRLDNNRMLTPEGVEIRLSDVSVLSTFRTLETLSLSQNQIQDITFLAELDQLSKLNLRQNDIHDISTLSNLHQLTYLNIHSNPNIQSVAPLSKLTKLTTLIMRHVPVGDQTWVFSGMVHLKRLNINNCGISDYTFLGEMMAEGILQDNPNNGVQANVNLRDNLLLQDGTDPPCPPQTSLGKHHLSGSLRPAPNFWTDRISAIFNE